MTRPAWAHGRNFDPNNLRFYTASRGFIIGESLIGVDPLGGAGADVELDVDFTSLQISSPTTVEQGLFVHREVETCTLTATLPAKLDLEGEWLIVEYYFHEVYRGRITDATWTETVEVDAAYKPGNTATRTHRVALTATNGEETLATTPTPARDFLAGETLVQRIAAWTGMSVAVSSPASDMTVGWPNAGWDTGYVKKVYRETDQLGSLLDTLRDETKLRNMTFVYSPTAAQPITLRSNAVWLVGTSAATALTFTDDPAHTEGQLTEPDDEYVHLGRYVSFTSRTVGKDPSLFTNQAQVIWGQYDVESPPVDGQPVQNTSAIYRASGANSVGEVVDLGVIDLQNGVQNPYRLARAVIGSLPLKGLPGRFTSRLVAPLQSVQQLMARVPGMALVEVDGVLERVAVLGQDHIVTPDQWIVSYTMGPPHLLDRVGDFDPGTANPNPQVAGPGGGQTTLSWTVPAYPTDATIYEVFYSTTSDLRLITSDQTALGVSAYPVAPAAGTTSSRIVSGAPSGTRYWVLYTSNPAVGTDNPSTTWREGQPVQVGQIP